jgi:hypothetical protein
MGITGKPASNPPKVRGNPELVPDARSEAERGVEPGILQSLYNKHCDVRLNRPTELPAGEGTTHARSAMHGERWQAMHGEILEMIVGGYYNDIRLQAAQALPDVSHEALNPPYLTAVLGWREAEELRCMGKSGAAHYPELTHESPPVAGSR